MVEKLILPFRNTLESVHHRALSSIEREGYGLAPDSQVKLQLKSQGRIWNGVDMTVGLAIVSTLKRSSGVPLVDTWVVPAAHPGRAFLMADLDLRDVLAMPVTAFYRQRVFMEKPSNIATLSLIPPGREGWRAYQDKGGRWTVTQKGSWVLKETSIQRVAESLARTLAMSFDPPGSPATKNGAFWRIVATKRDGTVYGLKLDATGAHACRLSGPPCFMISSRRAKNLRPRNTLGAAASP